MTENRRSGKLAVILHADIAGSTTLVQRDEHLAHERIQDTFRRFAETIDKYHGRVCELRGDALLAEFKRASDAVSATLAFQAEQAEHITTLDGNIRPTVRVGIAMGEVIIADNTITGAGVVLAQRIEQLAEPGGLCVTGAIHEALPQRMPFDLNNLGEKEVKGFSGQVSIYAVTLNPDAAIPEPETLPQAEAEEQGLSVKPSIAVLPFANISGDSEQEYFSDGLTEDLITALTLWRLFPVIARNSTFIYKNKAVDVKQIAKELGARYILEGSVRKSGMRVRITAQLINGKTAHNIWADKYDRELDDIFSLQDEITQQIVAVMVPEYEKAERIRSKIKRQTDLNAWDYYLRGMALIHEVTKAGNIKAREMFLRAIELDSEYSDAYVGLAYSHNRDLLMQCTDDREQSKAKSLEYSRRAVTLDDSSSSAHQSLSTAHLWRNEHDLALTEAQLTVKLNPYDAIGLHGLGNKSDLAGDPEGILRMLRAQQLNPQDSDRHIGLTFLARAYINSEEHDSAIKYAKLAINWRPDYPPAYFILAIALGHINRLDEAKAALHECERLQPGFVDSRSNWRPYTDNSRNKHLLAGLEKVL